MKKAPRWLRIVLTLLTLLGPATSAILLGYFIGTSYTFPAVLAAIAVLVTTGWCLYTVIRNTEYKGTRMGMGSIPVIGIAAIRLSEGGRKLPPTPLDDDRSSYIVEARFFFLGGYLIILRDRRAGSGPGMGNRKVVWSEEDVPDFVRFNRDEGGKFIRSVAA